MHLNYFYGFKVADNSDSVAPSCGLLKQVVESQERKVFIVKNPLMSNK